MLSLCSHVFCLSGLLAGDLGSVIIAGLRWAENQWARQTMRAEWPREVLLAGLRCGRDAGMSWVCRKACKLVEALYSMPRPQIAKTPPAAVVEVAEIEQSDSDCVEFFGSQKGALRELKRAVWELLEEAEEVAPVRSSGFYH